MLGFRLLPMQDEVNTKVVAIAIKGGRITAEVLKKALAKFIEELEKAEIK